MRKILLPPVLFIICILGMAWHARSGPHTIWHTGVWDILGYMLITLGFTLPIWGSVTFKKHKTNILPYKDPDNMVTDGPFKFTRNPMYLGMLTGLLGISVLIGTAESLFGPLLYFLVANWWYIPFEEERMKAMFGVKFENYKEKVRRWV